MVEVLNDRYELGEVVGSGGMGAVYRATDLRLGRTVAIKILRGGPLADEVSRSRMRSEASLAAAINHPGVAQVYDFEEDSAAHGGLSFIVMEFVEGHSLAQLLRDQGPMPTDQVMSVVVQVAEGLQAAHEAGVVHRDLKPANIMLTPRGRTVLVDFGIARSATSEPLTQTGAMIGTADYMSPEQAAGRPATPQSDLYALGVVAHHCLTGASPFKRESHIATALAHLNDDLPSLSPNAPPDVGDLIGSLTAKNPSERPTSAAAVALAAAQIGAATTISLPDTFETPVPTAADDGASGDTQHLVSPVAAPTRRRRPTKAVFAGVGVLVAALALLGIQQVSADDPPAVPDVVGMTAGDATTRIRDAGLMVDARTVDVAGKPKGEVVKQSPAGGQTGDEDEAVEIFVVSGDVVVSADDLIGLTYDKAVAALEELGFEVSRTDVTQATDIGKVVALDKAGRLPDGSAITLSVAVAPVVVDQPTGSSGSTGTAQPKTKAKSKGKGKGKK